MLFVYLFLCGVAAGVLGGMGMGGGTILIPMLTVFFKMSQTAAQGINLLSFIPMAAVALAIHIKNKMLDVKDLLPVALPAVAFSLAGSFLLKFVDGDIQKDCDTHDQKKSVKYRFFQADAVFSSLVNGKKSAGA